MQYNQKLRNTGLFAFFLSGICAISSGVVVSILQSHYGFAYGMTGTLLSCMSIGNMAASFASGFLPDRIGARNTVMILCSGYFLGYLMMTLTGAMPILLLAFLFVGIAKGCALNNCTVMVGTNSTDRTRGLSLMHAFYASGALLCPFLILFLQKRGALAPMMGLAVVGVFLWLIFMFSGLSNKKSTISGAKEKTDLSFLHNTTFWLTAALLFCQQAAETSVTGWLVTYYKNQNILSGIFSTYTVTVMWGTTLILRLLLTFVLPVRNTFKALTVMGIGCTISYSLMILAGQPITAILTLFLFAAAMAGVNPIAVAGVGKLLSNASMGFLLPIGGIGAIVMPWVIGIVADFAGLRMAMLVNLIPCVGIIILSRLLVNRR